MGWIIIFYFWIIGMDNTFKSSCSIFFFFFCGPFNMYIWTGVHMFYPRVHAMTTRLEWPVNWARLVFLNCCWAFHFHSKSAFSQLSPVMKGDEQVTKSRAEVQTGPYYTDLRLWLMAHGHRIGPLGKKMQLFFFFFPFSCVCVGLDT